MRRIFDRYEICRQLLPEARAALLQFDGVLGVGIGPRQQDGRLDPEQLCLIVYVEQKKPAAALQAHQFIPREFATIKTDVVQMGNREMARHNEFDRRWLAPPPASPAGHSRSA